MKELEKKVLQIKKEEVAENLEKIGAVKTFEGLLKVCYLDGIDSRIRNRGDLLRVREFGNKKTEIVYKTNKRIDKGCKLYDEYTLSSDNFDEALKFFEKLNLQITCSYEKKRSIYEYRNAEIVIDEYPKIPALLEIEGQSAEQIDEIIEQLGLSGYETSCETINELLKRKYPDIDLNNLKF